MRRPALLPHFDQISLLIVKIHHLSSAHFSGGAARAGFRIHCALLAAGHESVWVDAGRDCPERPDIVRAAPARRRWKGWARLLRLDERRRFRRAFSAARTLATIPSGPGTKELITAAGWPDLFHFHWVSDYLDWAGALPALTARVPVVWTLHDLNPLGGAWHYDPDADEIDPRRTRWEEKLRRRKREVLSRLPGDRLVFVAPSRWIAGRIRACEATSHFATHQIPYAIDTTIFCPGERDMMRAELDLPARARIVGFVADSISDRRKGVRELCEALALLPGNRPAVLVAVGGGALPLATENYRRIGRIQDDARLRAFYAACDLFVCPSLQDNLPNTVLEAMACGTPVVAFDTGGIPDMVSEGETGRLVPTGDIKALAGTIAALLDDEAARARMGRSGRARVEADFSPGVVARRHAELYLGLLDGRGL